MILRSGLDRLECVSVLPGIGRQAFLDGLQPVDWALVGKDAASLMR